MGTQTAQVLLFLALLEAFGAMASVALLDKLVGLHVLEWFVIVSFLQWLLSSHR